MCTDEYWQAHAELHDIPVYYASQLAHKCMSVYQTFVSAMNERIRREFSSRNPFHFRHISALKAHLLTSPHLTPHVTLHYITSHHIDCRITRL